MSVRARGWGWRRLLPVLCVLAIGVQLGPLTEAQEPTLEADLSLVKTDRVDPVTVGDEIIYDLRFHNDGPDDAVDMQIVDTLPDEVEFVSGQASHNGRCTYTAADRTVTCAGFQDIPDDNSQGVAHITVKAIADGNPTNTATVSSDSVDLDSSNNSDSEDTQINPIPPPPPSADLSTTKSVSSASVNNGETFSYGLTVTNAGPDAASGASVSDVLPSGVEFVSATGCSHSSGTVTCSLGDMAPGSTDFTINVKATSVGTKTNTATATSSTPDPDGDNNTSNSVVTEVAPTTDLSLTKDGPATAETGDSLTYTLNVANAGPDAADGVTVSDTLPESLTFGSSDDCTHLDGTVTCSLGTVEAGGGDSASFTATANEADTVVNSASVSSGTHDPSSGNNSGSATTVVTDPPPTPTPTEEPTPTPTEEPTPTPTEEPTPTPTEEPTPTPTEEPTPTPTEEPTPTPAVETSTPTPTTSTAASPPPEPIDSCPTSSRQAAGLPGDGLLAFVPAAIQLERQRRRRISLVDDKPSAGKGGKRSRSKVIKIVAVIAVIAVAAVVGVLLLTGGDKGKNYATLGALEGRVDLQKSDEGFETATQAATLNIGDKVRTGDDGLARIDYTDGSLTRLDHNTTFQVQELINDKTHKSIRTKLDVGRVMHRVEKLTKQEDRFEVKTVTAVATVQGTIMSEDCRAIFNGHCNHVTFEGLVKVIGNLGDSESIPGGQCRTEEDSEIDECQLSNEEIANDSFYNQVIKEFAGDAIDLSKLFGEDKKVALVPVEDEPEIQAAQETPATTTTPTEEPACPTGHTKSGGTSLPLAAGIALMIIFFGIAWARPNRKSGPAADSAN